VKEAFVEKLYECNRHVQTIKTAKKHIAHRFPLTVKSYQEVSDVELSFIDQIVYRFSKLQDTLGDKIFASLLILLGEEIKQMPFIDRLNRLEELELVDMHTWMNLRKIRNDIAHEYVFNFDEVVNNLNEIFIESDTLLKIYEELLHFAKKRFDFVRESKLLK
jgi:uncharacterized protein with HEPN domain